MCDWLKSLPIAQIARTNVEITTTFPGVSSIPSTSTQHDELKIIPLMTLLFVNELNKNYILSWFDKQLCILAASAFYKISGLNRGGGWEAEVHY